MRLSRLRQSFALCAAAAAVCGLCGCGGMLSGLVGTQIVVRGSRQSLREQVLGAYDNVGHEVFLLAGVRSVDPETGTPHPPPKMTDSERRALQAGQSMAFNRDDVLRFKRLGYVGEGRDALPVFFPRQRELLAGEDPWLAALVQALTEEETRDRQRIMRRILETTPSLDGMDGMATVQAILAAKYRAEAEPGMMVQAADGAWGVKPGGETGE